MLEKQTVKCSCIAIACLVLFLFGDCSFFLFVSSDMRSIGHLSDAAVENVPMWSAQNSHVASSPTEWMAQLNLSRRVLEKSFSMGTLNLFEKTTVRRGSM